MTFPENLWLSDVDAYWVTDGPSSGGIRGWLLWNEHMFAFEHSGPSGSVEHGIPAARFLALYGDSEDSRYAAIVDDLRTRGFR